MDTSKDELFYFSLLTFKAEDTLFRVPKERFEESQHFQDMFTLPSGEISEGDKDERPIVLDGIKAHDFRAFLSLLYLHPNNYINASTIEEERCVAALHLATMWSIESVRTLAKKLLLEMKLHPVRLLELARMYDFKDGTDVAVHALATRLDSLIAYELATRIGLEFFYAVAESREKSRGESSTEKGNSTTALQSPSAFGTYPTTIKSKKKKKNDYSW